MKESYNNHTELATQNYVSCPGLRNSKEFMNNYGTVIPSRMDFQVFASYDNNVSFFILDIQKTTRLPEFC